MDSCFDAQLNSYICHLMLVHDSLMIMLVRICTLFFFYSRDEYNVIVTVQLMTAVLLG
jgi:hypothetical protein